MQQARSQNRAPGSFSPLTGTTSNSKPPANSAASSRPPPIKTSQGRAGSVSSDEATPTPTSSLGHQRSRNPTTDSATPSIYSSATYNSSSSSLHQQQPTPRSLRAVGPGSDPTSPATAAALAARANLGGSKSPLSPLSPHSIPKGHRRNHSQTQGHFEPILPSTSTNNLSMHTQQQPSHQYPGISSKPPLSIVNPHNPNAPNPAALAAAAQAAMQHNQTQHLRQRSQTVPAPGAENSPVSSLGPPYDLSQKPRGASTSGGKGLPVSPPMLSLTEASAPRESGFRDQVYHNGLMGNHTAAATTAANVVFQRPGTGGATSPSLSTQTSAPSQLMADREREREREREKEREKMVPELKPKAEKSRKLFGRPSKISVKGEVKEKPIPSPGKIGAALSSLQRGNFSTTSLVESSSAASLYTLGNSSSATIRAVDSSVDGGSMPPPVKKSKEKKHHFLSRQKDKLTGSKESDYHSFLSSSSSNSKPTDPHGPGSIYNFQLPPSPGPTTTTFKSGLDLRHGGRRDKKKEKDQEKQMQFDDTSSIHTTSEWPGPGSLGTSFSNQTGGSYLHEPLDPAKLGLNNMSKDDAWPYLKAKLLVIFEGEDLRLPVEDLNRVVSMHIQYCVQRRAPHIIIEDLRDLLSTGFTSLDQTLRMTPEDRLIPALVELWMFTFTSILPYMQAVFLPLDLEFSGTGSILTPEQARDFWGGVLAHASASVMEVNSPTEHQSQGIGGTGAASTTIMSPVAQVLDVRRIVLQAYRDAVILPRYDTLRQIFSRLSLEFLPMAMALASPPPIPISGANASAGSSFVDQSNNPLSTSPAASETLSLMSMPGGLQRPGTAMSLDPALASYNSTGTTLLGDNGSITGLGNQFRGDSNSGSNSALGNNSMNNSGGNSILSGSRSRAISNVSFGSNLSAERPGSSAANLGVAGAPRDNLEDSKQVTEMVGRMLQCMSVLGGVGIDVSSNNNEEGVGSAEEEGNRKIGELCRLLKLNWLGRGRTGRNRRGIVGGRVRRGGVTGGPGGLSSLVGLGGSGLSGLEELRVA